MISKWIEDGEAVNVFGLFIGLKHDLERVKNENYANT
jgi:hypothetical protein|tara:strand:+ start:703 stop:813 length:111 start_codon:yes stop_codon:yes gene_type:complete